MTSSCWEVAAVQFSCQHVFPSLYCCWSCFVAKQNFFDCQIFLFRFICGRQEMIVFLFWYCICQTLFTLDTINSCFLFFLLFSFDTLFFFLSLFGSNTHRNGIHVFPFSCQFNKKLKNDESKATNKIKTFCLEKSIFLGVISTFTKEEIS